MDSAERRLDYFLNETVPEVRSFIGSYRKDFSYNIFEPNVKNALGS